LDLSLFFFREIFVKGDIMIDPGLKGKVAVVTGGNNPLPNWDDMGYLSTLYSQDPFKLDI
jgi:hypothetical protein